MAQGKGSRAKTKSRRDAQKRQRREANRNRFTSIIGTDANTKDKSKKNRKVAETVRARLHVTNDCGNLACKRCYPALNLKIARLLTARRTR